jgi:hypothetical protein
MHSHARLFVKFDLHGLRRSNSRASRARKRTIKRIFRGGEPIGWPKLARFRRG